MKKLSFIFLLISILVIGCTQLAKKTDTTVDTDLRDSEQETSSDLEIEGIDELDLDEDLEEDLEELEDSLDFDF